MKLKITSLIYSILFLITTNSCLGQAIIARFNEQSGRVLIQQRPENAKRNDPADTLIIVYKDKKGKEGELIFLASDSNSIKANKINMKGLRTEFSMKPNGNIIFTHDRKSELQILFCKEKKCFAIGKCPDSKEPRPNGTTIKDFSFLSDFPFPPQFAPKSDSIPDIFPNDSIGYYHFVIDADADINRKKNNELYVKKLRNGKASYKIVRAIKVNSSFSVFIKNYNFNNLESVNINVNGIDYHYDQSLGSLLEKVNDSAKEIKKGVGDSGAAVRTDRDDSLKIVENNLQWVNEYLMGYSSLNIKSISLLNEYKSKLAKFFEKHFNLFNKESIDLLNKILTWYPGWVSLTPTALTVPDNDEIEIELRIKEKQLPEEKYNLGSYRVKNGASVIAVPKGSLFFTNLKNREAYIDSTDHKVKLDSKNNLSIGIGASGIVSFRTGSALTPTFSLGFFVPLDEEISPFGQIGPGLNYGTRKVGLNFSAGLAFGKVNDIKPQYKGIDMRTIINPDINGITRKVFKLGWVVSLGLEFNKSK